MDKVNKVLIQKNIFLKRDLKLLYVFKHKARVEKSIYTNNIVLNFCGIILQPFYCYLIHERNKNIQDDIKAFLNYFKKIA
jgi:hypothetical protein